LGDREHGVSQAPGSTLGQVPLIRQPGVTPNGLSPALAQEWGSSNGETQTAKQDIEP
jgi:hypothetical protein